MQPTWQTTDGAVKLYLGDCREILPTLPPVDACVTDPPYGIGYDAARYPGASFSGVMHGDDEEFNPLQLLTLNVPTILWGANNYCHSLPIGGWICWDKRTCEEADRCFGSPFELAWCSMRTKFKIIRLMHGGPKNADSPNGDSSGQKRIHPTQKPVKLFTRCLSFLPDAETILDPFAGSMTTVIACIRTGRKCIAIEREPSYFWDGVKRIEAEIRLLASSFQLTAKAPQLPPATFFPSDKKKKGK